MKLFKAVDVDGDKELSEEEFVQVLAVEEVKTREKSWRTEEWTNWRMEKWKNFVNPTL